MNNLNSESNEQNQNGKLSDGDTNNVVADANKFSTVNVYPPPPKDPGSDTLFKSQSSSDSSSLGSPEIIETKKAPTSTTPWTQSEVDVGDLVTQQKIKFEIGGRAKSPSFCVPIDCLYPDMSLSPHKIAWIENQKRKAKDIIFDYRFEDAIAMVKDGRAQILVSNGYNMYGEKLMDGMNFFDKPLKEGYGMYDWLPMWVKNFNSPFYYEVKRTPLL